MLEAMAYTELSTASQGYIALSFFHPIKTENIIEKLSITERMPISGGTESVFHFDSAPEMDEQAMPKFPPASLAPDSAIEVRKGNCRFYISGHPLDTYKPLITNYTTTDLKRLSDANQQTGLTIECCICRHMLRSQKGNYQKWQRLRFRSIGRL
jgi:DNA polymerase III alpha subunit